jgi:SSS family transporter
MSSLDFLVIGVYFAATVLIGSLSGKGQKTGIAYFLADRSMHWLPASITMTAVSISAITFVGMPGQAFKSDWTFLQLYLLIPLAAWVVCKVFLPHYNRLSVVTAYEYLETRFDSLTRRWASALFQVILCGSTGVVIYAPSIMLAEVTGFSVVFCVLIVGAVTTLYTVIGGVKGVIYTDLLQALLSMVGWAIVVWFIARALPEGLAGAWQVAADNDKLRFFDFTLDPHLPATFWSAMSAMFFTHLALAGVNHTQVQKFLTVASLEGGQRAILVHGVMQLGVYFAFFGLGTLLFVFYQAHPERLPEGIAPDRVLPSFIMRELPAGLRGLLVTAVFAAAMSTISSAINSLASATVVDFLETRFKTTLWQAKLVAALWGGVVVAAALLAWRLGSILELIVKVNSYFYGCLLGVFLLGMLTRKTDGRGARLGLLASMIAVLLCSLWSPSLWIWFGGIGCLVCCAVGYTCSSWKLDEIRSHPPQRTRY